MEGAYLPFVKSTAWLLGLLLLGLAPMRLPSLKRRLTLLGALLALRLCMDLLSIFRVTVPDAMDKGLSFAFVLLLAAFSMGMLRDLSFSWFQRRSIKVSGLFWDVFQVMVFAVLGLVLLKRVFGINVTPLLATSAILTVVVGLAVQDTLGNLIAGIVFHFEDSIRPGEWVEVDGLIGEVTGLSWRAIVLTTPNLEQLVIPNHDFTKKRFANLSRNGAARPHSISIGYTHDPDHVVAVLKKAMLSTPGIRKQPEPVAHILKFGESSIEYRLKYFLEDYRTVNSTMGEMYRQVWYFLKTHRLTLPNPVRTIHVEKKPQEPVPDRAHLLETLQTIEMFRGFNALELADIAAFADLQDFEPGAVVSFEGEVGTSMGVIVRGSVNVLRQDVQVATLAPGDLFGEISLFTGDRCNASVVAASPLTLLAIRKEGFETILRGNVNFIGKIEEMMRMRLAALQAHHGPDARHSDAGDLLTRIRKYLLG